MKNLAPALSIALISISLFACNKPVGVKKITFALTNDLHGHIKPKKNEAASLQVGGLSYFADIIHSLRTKREYQENSSALFLLDSGDQFQGTLLSNFDEGKAIFKAMNEIGYDAIVPGNHDYDFGPIGWLYDRVTPGETSTDPREVITHLASISKFPLLSANTYLKNSIKDPSTAQPINLNSECKPINQQVNALDFKNATQPSFLKRYTIIKKAGVRVALIGIDHHSTATMTTIENVSDLCFRDEVDSYLELRAELEGQAEIFVMILHNGNSGNSKGASEITKTINNAYKNGVNLVAAGHTHIIHNDNVDGVSVIQNGSGGEFFGLVNLYWDVEGNKLVPEKSESVAGIQINHQQCVENNFPGFCKFYPVPLNSNATIDSIIQALDTSIAPLAAQTLATAIEPIKRDRISENAVGNILTDALRAVTKTDISFMNAGGIRTDIKPGVVKYEDFFEVIPFNNLAVTLNEVPWKTIKAVLSRSIQTCGRFGALNESGLKIKYSRICTPNSDLDENAKLIRVETVKGEVLFDSASEVEVSLDKKFSVVTLDFIASGGAGYIEFIDSTISKTNGIARELIAQELSRTQPVLTNLIDQRLNWVRSIQSLLNEAR